MNCPNKIIFFDIDGTVWDWSEVIPDSTCIAVRELIAGGHLPVICSGRAKSHLLSKSLTDMGFRDMVAACGGYVEADGVILYDNHLDDRQIQKVIELSEECRLPIVLEGPEYHWISEKGFEKDDFVDRMYKNMGDRAVCGLKYSKGMVVNKVAGDILNCSDYYKFKSLLEDDFDFIEHGLALNVDQNPGLEDNAIQGVYEIVPKGTHKAFGIEKYCEYRGINPKDTIAVGDSANDIEMLETVGYGIAMGNATGHIRDIADYITDDIHNDGLYNAMKYLKLI